MSRRTDTTPGPVAALRRQEGQPTKDEQRRAAAKAEKFQIDHETLLMHYTDADADLLHSLFEALPNLTGMDYAKARKMTRNFTEKEPKRGWQAEAQRILDAARKEQQP